MHCDDPDLTIEILPGLRVPEPFGIPSCHLTGSPAQIRAIGPLRPAFFTLKSTSIVQGGDGRGRRFYKMLECAEAGGNPQATYLVDGEKHLEMLDLETTRSLLLFAREQCPNSKIGVSLTAGEEYPNIIPQLEEAGADFLELCFKYTPRQFGWLLDQHPALFMSRTFEYVALDVDRALQTSSVPIFLKLPRDLPWITSAIYLQTLKQKSSERVGFILADTKKQLAYFEGRREAREGVICGSSLLPETLFLLRQAAQRNITPVIATGGIFDARDAYNALRNGASAILLCTTLQYNGLRYYDQFRREFSMLLLGEGIRTYSDLSRYVDYGTRKVA